MSYGDYKPFDGRVDPVRRGTVVVSLAAASSGSTAVTFNFPFVNPPIVSVQVIGTSFYFGTATVPTTTGFSPGAAHRDGTTATTSLTVHWTAIEP